MSTRKKQLKEEQKEIESIIEEVNNYIEYLGKNAKNLYENLTEIQELFDKIRNVPSEQWLQYQELKKVRLTWKDQAEKIEKDFKGMIAKNAGAGGAGVGAGVAVVAMGPTAAMGVATTFGVASTGTAISTLSGAAATNAALAWLGGGALAAGGGGMAAGEAFLAFLGPLGWAIAGLALLTSGIFLLKGLADQHIVQDIFILIGERDKKRYKLAIVELKERIKRIREENKMLETAIAQISSFGTDYTEMTEKQQYELGAYVNLMNSSTQLLVNPILGIQPQYTEGDFGKYMQWRGRKSDTLICHEYKNIIIAFANLLYEIPLDEKAKKLLWKTFKSNKKMLKALGITKKELSYAVMEAVYEATNRAALTKYYINE